MKGHWSPFWVAIIIFLSAFPNPILSLTKFFLNGSFPLERPIFLINFDLSTVLCQHSADPQDLHSHELSVNLGKIFPSKFNFVQILCDGKLDCFPRYSPQLNVSLCNVIFDLVPQFTMNPFNIAVSLRLIHFGKIFFSGPMECAGMTCSNRGACLFDGQKARCFCNSGSFGQNCELSGAC